MDKQTLWMAEALRLEQWSREPAVPAETAVLLLAGHDGNITLKDALEISTPGLTQVDKQMFGVLLHLEPRKLVEWNSLAEETGLSVHPRVSAFLQWLQAEEAMRSGKPSAGPSTEDADGAAPPPPKANGVAVVTTKTGRDRDELAPLIRRIYEDHPEWSPTEAWNELMRLAGVNPPLSPLTGTNGREVSFLGATGRISKKGFSARWRRLADKHH